jgi:hypothetical protein
VGGGGFVEGFYGWISGGDGFPCCEAGQQLGQPQGLQCRHLRGQGHPQAIRGEGPAVGIKGRQPLPIVGRDQGQGFGGSEHPPQPQAIVQPVPVGLQQLGGLPFLAWGDRIGGPQSPALSQAEAGQGSPFAGLQLAAAGQLGRFGGGDRIGFE